MDFIWHIPVHTNESKKNKQINYWINQSTNQSVNRPINHLISLAQYYIKGISVLKQFISPMELKNHFRCQSGLKCLFNYDIVYGV